MRCSFFLGSFREVGISAVVCHMKKLILVLILISSPQLKSQEVKDFKTIESIENYILGFWTKAENTENGIQYLIEKTDNEFYLSTGVAQNGGLEFLVKDKIRLEIILKKKKVLIKNIELENKHISKLIYLDSNKMTLKSRKKLTDYSKVE